MALDTDRVGFCRSSDLDHDSVDHFPDARHGSSERELGGGGFFRVNAGQLHSVLVEGLCEIHLGPIASLC